MIKIEEKKRDPLPGEPGHYRYEKDKKVGANKATGIDTPGLKKEVKEEAKTEDTAYSKTDVKDMNRNQQEKILNERNVKFTDKDKELTLIQKIVSSNPKK